MSRIAHFQGKIAFNAWKQSDFPSEGNVYHVYHSKRKEHRHKLREFLNQLEVDKIIKLSHAAESNEKLFSRPTFFFSDDRERHFLQTEAKFVKCGPTILKLWEPHLLMITLTTISVLILVIVFTRRLIPA